VDRCPLTKRKLFVLSKVCDDQQSRRDAMFTDIGPNCSGSSIGANCCLRRTPLQEHFAPTEVSHPVGRGGNKHSAPTEPDLGRKGESKIGGVCQSRFKAVGATIESQQERGFERKNRIDSTSKTTYHGRRLE